MVISLATEAAGAGNYPANRLGQRERKILESVKTYVDGLVASPEAASVRSATAVAIAAISDATAGDIYYDSTNNKLVVFTGAATSETITSA